MRGLFIAIALWGLSAVAGATPTRVLAIDGQNQLVPDDWDAVYYYSLAPNFKNHFYVDVYPDGTGSAWAFLDVSLGTLVIWWNKAYEGKGLFDAHSGIGNGLGLSALSLDATAANPWEPLEKRLLSPDSKLALGWGMPVTDGLNLGFCLRYAQSDLVRDSSAQSGAAAFGASAGAYQGSEYAGFNTTAYQNRQSSSGWILVPQLSYAAEKLTFDGKVEFILQDVANRHEESLDDGGSAVGTLTHELLDRPKMAWHAKGKLRYQAAPEFSWVLRGDYGVLGLDLEHRVKGAFSGALSARQLAGFDHVDASQAFSLKPWSAMLGAVKSLERGKHLLVLGIGANGATSLTRTESFQPRSGGAGIDALAPASVAETATEAWAVPLIFGGEATLASWCRARLHVSRNFFAGERTLKSAETYDATGALIGRVSGENGSSESAAWAFNSGLGLQYGRFAWDALLSTQVLAGAGAFSDPLLQSSFTFTF
jgi:hypothetical protein